MILEAISDLELWPEEEGVPLPLPVGDIIQAETRGQVVDLQSGRAFRQADSWMDFAERWVVEIERRGEIPSAERLAAAVGRACGGGWSVTFCNAVAWKVLSPALERVCTVQAVA